MLDRAALKAAVRRILHRHDRANPVSMTHLFQRVTGATVIPARRHEQSRVIRTLVRELRLDGYPVAFVGGKHGGYYMARDEAELIPTIRVLHSHAMSNLQVEAALKRLPFSTLLQQYDIEFNEKE